MVVCVLAWAATVGWAGRLLLRHADTPGTQANAPATWLPIDGVTPSATRPTLVLFAHPKCPCTRATMSELARLIGRTHDGFDTVVLFYKPAGAPDTWAMSDTWRSAITMPGTRVVIDPDGKIAARFGAETSGQAMLFDPKGVLVFQGGLTPSRGHEGDNAGSEAITAFVRSGTRPPAPTSVFGCAIGSGPVLSATSQPSSTSTVADLR